MVDAGGSTGDTDLQGTLIYKSVNTIRGERNFPTRASYLAAPAGWGGRKQKLGFRNVNRRKPKKVFYVDGKNLGE